MEKKYNKEIAVLLLKDKFRLLEEERYPKRSDFTNEETVAIKAYLGAWPRALETAGIKPKRNDDFKQNNKEKRIRSKQRRLEYKKQDKLEK